MGYRRISLLWAFNSRQASNLAPFLVMSYQAMPFSIFSLVHQLNVLFLVNFLIQYEDLGELFQIPFLVFFFS